MSIWRADTDTGIDIHKPEYLALEFLHRTHFQLTLFRRLPRSSDEYILLRLICVWVFSCSLQQKHDFKYHSTDIKASYVHGTGGYLREQLLHGLSLA